ncbi:MAG: recombinase family protein [Rickettsia endosymbiont of Oxypoda opaca]|nr:recombinase family protein [Rickettsia endosymbiont of Oxypoda opaca]
MLNTFYTTLYSRTFAYVRVSKIQQDTEKQIREIELAGFTIAPHRIIIETVSGSMPITQRQGFAHLLNKMEN